jgi:hypothetical protein
MTRCYHLISRLIRISDWNFDAVRGDGRAKVERSVSEVNLVHAPAVRLFVHPFQHVCHPVWFISLSFVFPPGRLVDKIPCSLPLLLFMAPNLA